MLRLTRLMLLLAMTHVGCLGSVLAPVLGVPMLASLCSAAVL